MAFWKELRMFQWLYFGLKGLPLFSASCFAAFLYYEQGNTVAIAHSLSFDPVRSIYSSLYSL
ncbi:hypothetical protein EU509_00410 [Pseudoalteromonas fuliginea]|uniref:Uncharacterized protein n=1 Tax=Pseudoalteromonas fuliginea TaxID=1872678 RepID=A0ABQ6RNE3_9GAMM|nr:hypothetical protein EU509_00410 [Pseudoalteromonas fuliginea]KAA1170035.1 hypothetical protein EUZ79_00225 [Pseudoalteromonas fuliginea]